MQYFYIIPFKEKSLFKLGRTDDLKRRFREHTLSFNSKGLTFDYRDIVYCKCDHLNTVHLIEMHLRKRFTPVIGREVFSLDKLDEIKELVISLGLPVGFSEFKKYKQARSKRKVKMQSAERKTLAEHQADELRLLKQEEARILQEEQEFWDNHGMCVSEYLEVRVELDKNSNNMSF